jgi:hypothetical protein
VYNLTVANRQNLQELENDPYFAQRLTEAQLAEERAEAEAKGANKLAQLIKKGYDVDTALKMVTGKNS